MSAATSPIQDMPPNGGYQKINFARVPAKRLFSGVQMIIGFLAFHGVSALGVVYITRPYKRFLETEERSALIAMHPFFQAERDRRVLLQLRRNRDVEEELMKDIDGWQVGKYFDEPIYKTLGSDEWYELMHEEYYLHSPPGDMHKNNNIEFRR